MDIWVGSTFGLLWIMPKHSCTRFTLAQSLIFWEHSHTSFWVNMFSVFLGRYLGLGLLGPSFKFLSFDTCIVESTTHCNTEFLGTDYLFPGIQLGLLPTGPLGGLCSLLLSSLHSGPSQCPVLISVGRWAAVQLMAARASRWSSSGGQLLENISNEMLQDQLFAR